MQSAHTFSWQAPFDNQRFQILFVDDDLYALKTVRKVLEKASYPVLTATTYADALEMIQQHHIHLGIFDLNLAREDEAPDEAQPQNRQGLDLAVYPDFPLLRMVYTGEEDYQIVVETLEHPQAVNYIVKGQDSDSELLEKVALALGNRLPLNQDLQIHWNNTSLQSIIQTIDPDLTLTEQTQRLYELDDLFRLQFFGFGQEMFEYVSIEMLSPDLPQRVWLRVSAFTQRGRRFDSLVLCGKREIILHEATQFQKLSPRSNQMRTPPTQTVHYGLHAYDVFNDRLPHIQPIEHQIVGGRYDAMTMLLQALSSEIFQRQYSHDTRDETGTLYQLAFGLDEHLTWETTEVLYQVVNRMIEHWHHQLPHLHLRIDQQMLHYGMERNRAQMQHPVMHLEALGNQEVSRPVGWVHGQLSLATIFADLKESTLYLLDYTDAHLASLLRDFVTLERSVHTAMLCQIDIPDYGALANALTEESIKRPSLPAKLQHATTLIMQVREQALQTTGCSLEDYLQDLYMDLMAFLMTYPERPYVNYQTVRRYVHCLLFAAQICTDLQERGIISDTQQQTQDGIWLDADSYLLRGLGKAVQLTEKQYGIFELLYQDMGQEFSYAAIIEHGLGETFLHDNIELEKPRIQTAISRLRVKLQPFHFEIEAGREGYRLHRNEDDS